MTPTTKAALYLRISTSDGKQTLETQRRELRAYAKRLKWPIVAEYSDQITGTSTTRPGLDRMLEEAAEHRFDVVVVFDLSRLTRNGPASAFALIERLRASGVDLWSFREEYFRTSGPAGAVLIAIAAFLANQEREMIRARVNAGIRRARESGVRLGRRPVLVDRVKVAELREQGKSIRECARELKVSKNVISRAISEERG